jgi:hypothetical protein
MCARNRSPGERGRGEKTYTIVTEVKEMGSKEREISWVLEDDK